VLDWYLENGQLKVQMQAPKLIDANFAVEAKRPFANMPK
jgi:hypothetical protein